MESEKSKQSIPLVVWDNNGEVIDLTSKQYSLHNIGVPSFGMAARLKEQDRRTWFASQKKKKDKWW